MSDPAPPPPPEEPKVEIHKPKPIHNWREFLKEYAIIVLGVITALAGEQAVERMHDNAKAAEARTHIRAEIGRNLHLLDQRAATEGCIAKRLAEVDGLIGAPNAGTLPKTDIWIGHPVAYAVLDGRYKAATQSGSVSLFDDQEQADYAELYEFMAIYYQQVVGEQLAWGDLRILEDHPPASTALDLQLRNAMKRARAYRYYIQTLDTQIKNDAARMGFAQTPVRKRVDAACLPLHTPRAEAQKAIMADRADKGTYDEP
jgi:predicted nucleic acid-binding protein